MPVTDTPLRYPGGKSQILPFVIDLLRENDLFYGEYAEPFAGGAGVALSLLLNNYVNRIYINDIDPSIYAFWHSVLQRTDEFVSLIENTTITMDEWHTQREIYSSSETCHLARGFATFFLNRTNRSGIIKGGVIGGKEQNGDYKLDCRFNKNDLIRKIRRIAKFSDRIELFNLDSILFLQEVVKKSQASTLINLDPPYFLKGPELYANFYSIDDHRNLAKAVSKLDRPWMVTYDDAPEIRNFYSQFPMYFSNLNYSAQDKKVGTELLVLKPSLVAPNSIHPLRIYVKSEQ
jgi:DNA adenine methylase